MSSDEDRYQEILRRIAKDKAEKQAAPDSSLEQILDHLNAFDLLNGFARQPFARTLCYGPQVFKGAAWVGVVVWYRRKGYYGYRKLTICGIWASQQENAIQVILGKRLLNYAAPVYVAEAYHKLIRTGFDVYYNDKGYPPEEQGMDMQILYDPRQRLAIRERIEQHLQQWTADL